MNMNDKYAIIEIKIILLFKLVKLLQKKKLP